LAFLHQSAAAQFTVTNTNGGSPTFSSGDGSLPGEVTASNNNGGLNTVTWQAGNVGAISLANVLGINGGTTLDASNAGGAVSIVGAGLALNGAVTFANSGSGAAIFSIDGGGIQGAGSLTKTGTGVVTLTGSNSYAGGTFLNAGILNVNSDAALGNASGGLTFNGGTLQAGAALSSARNIALNANGTFDSNSFTSVLTGVISGPGQLAVADSAGGGVLVLTNTGNTYSGGTLFKSGTLNVTSDSMLGTGGLEFNGGALQAGASLTDSRNVVLDSLGGTFDSAGTTSTFSGLITGGGALTKISSGTLILTGANTYTGGTVINGGVLAVYNDGNLGDTVSSITLNGGVLQMLGAFATNRSVVLGMSSGTIDTNGFNDSFTGAFTGAGGLTKIGAGILTLGGANSYTGGTFVNGGTLQMGNNNVLPSNNNMTIAGGATFDMNGFSQTNALGTVTNNGLINVGLGQLSLGTYQGAGTLALTLQPGPGGANVTTPNVIGTSMILTGGTLALKVASPAVKTGETFTAISATTLNGTMFASIVSPAAVSFSQGVNGGDLILTATLVPFASLASSPNQAAVGGALESLRAQAQSNPTGPAGSVIGSLYSLNTPQIQAAFDQIGPIALASMSSLGLAGSGVQSEALGRRMTALDDDDDTGFTSNSINERSSSPGTPLAAGGAGDTDLFGNPFWKQDNKGQQNKNEQQDQSNSPWGFFASGVGTSGHLSTIDASAGIQPGYDYTSGGLVVGGDYKLADKLAVGMSAGYLYGHANVYTAQNSTVDNNSARSGVYATGHSGDFRADLYAGGALDFFSTNRGILFGDTQEAATAHPTGVEFNANADFSYDFDTDWGVISPFAGINEDRVMIHAFSESGAGALDLDVAPQTDQSLRSSLGVRQSEKTKADGLTLQSHWSLGWLHEFMDQSVPIAAQLASGGSVFSVQTAGLPRDGALAGIGVVMSGEDTSVSVDYSADLREHFIESVFNASLHYRF
jgi:autotransporter-associated beta strand protein